MPPPVLVVPGLANSGPGHWQTLWEKKYAGFRRVEQDNWDFPIREEWVKRLDHYIEEAESPPLLVAHSLGCLTVVHWANQHTRELRGALLVVPPDLEAPGAPWEESDFLPVPKRLLPFPSVVVSSDNDTWCALQRGHALAKTWGSRFLNAGACGHINADAGFGSWSLGEELLAELLSAPAPELPASSTKRS